MSTSDFEELKAILVATARFLPLPALHAVGHAKRSVAHDDVTGFYQRSRPTTRKKRRK